MLDGLMGGSVFAQTDGIVGKNVDDAQLHQRRQTNRRPHIVGKDEEGAAVRDDAAVQSQTVQDGSHAIFTHAKTEVTAVKSLFLNILRAL